MISAEKEKVLGLFADGLKYYKQADFRKAFVCFNDALSVDPNDGPSKVYVERCRDLMENPPVGEWDGVYTMKTK